MVSASVRYLFYQPMDEKIKTWTLRFLAKENRNMEKALFDWPIVLQHDVKVNYRLILRNPVDKPIKSLDFRSFVVSVLFARFHFKVKRKLLYLTFYHVSLKSDQQQFSPRKRNGYEI